ncbi:MAG: hypothetical protein L3J49_10610 [Desulfobulbaceae bacterium]|nr:hypothetical protein [Desulfobulbaceae bacterium]
MGRQPIQLAECVKRHYRGLVIRAAEWICYVDEDTGLPRPSWDLWEERYGVHSWTVATVWAGVGGMARYENDSYHQISVDTARVPGNPWFIRTLWLAQWFITTATSEKDLQAALECIEWVADHTLESGVMAEQVHPYTNEPLSVSPLTWSHATYVDTLLKYHKKDMELAGDNH